MSSLKTNIFWNSIRTGSNLIFPLITFPYISRVLGPESIGLFNYVTAIATYFTLFASLGFPIYGIREIASIKDRPEKFAQIVNAIFTTNTLSTLIVYSAYTIISFIIGGNDILLYFIIGLSILMSCISFDWFYQGIEDFKYITIRSLIIKCFSIIGLFIFVHNPSDLIAYAILSIVGTCGNNILNLWRIRKYLKLKFSFVDCWKHTKGASVLFLGTIAVSLYTQLNSIMIGAMGSMEAVGYFTTGNKIVQLIMTMITAVTATIIPRMSYLINNNKEKEAIQLQKKVVNLLIYIGLPMISGLTILAKPIILLLSGEEFLPSVIILQILASLLIIIPLSSFFGLQILYPMHKEKYGNYAVITGAIINMVLNFLLIPFWGHIGVAISVLCAEAIITLIHYLFAKKYMKLRLRDFLPLKAFIATIIMTGAIYYLNTKLTALIYLPLICLCGILIYALLLIILKDKFIRGTLFKIIIKK